MWALKSVVIDRMSIARIAAGLGVSWHTVNDAVLATGHRLLIADPTRFDGVQVLGLDEHAWRHTRRGDKFVTVIIDLTPVRDGTGPSRLLDMAEGRSKQAFKTWLEAQTPAFRNRIEIEAMEPPRPAMPPCTADGMRWRPNSAQWETVRAKGRESPSSMPSSCPPSGSMNSCLTGSAAQSC
jgi:hypothetical protein